MNRVARIVMAGGVLAALLPAAGCLGPFAATRRLWHWNRRFDGEWTREAVFLCPGMLPPTYLLTALADALLFNPVCFWNGEGWIDLPGGDHHLQSAPPWERDPALDGLIAEAGAPRE